MTAMDLTIHTSFLPHDDPETALAFWRDTLGFQVRNDVGHGKMRWLTVGPPDQPGTSILLGPPAADPGVTDEERRMIVEMMAKGSYGWILLPPPTSTARSSGCRPAPRSSRSRPSSRTGFATAPSATPPAT
jgi:catechol 2,3-dioxygenase-like lactoylglutathione lyase family enzyme